MALEDDLRTTINEIRADYRQQAADRSAFLDAWGELRRDFVLPAFRRSIVVFKELEWQSEQDASNGAATLRLGEVQGDARGANHVWLYALALKPNPATRKVEIHTVNKRSEDKSLDELTPPVIDQIITEFARRAEEDFQRGKLPT
jgi:hypothetical protein